MNKKSRYASLLLFMSLVVVAITPAYSNLAFAEDKAFTEILYSIKLGEETYLIHFNACAGDKSIFSPKITMESELDTVQINSSKIIHANSCQDYESIITTKSPQFVKITIVD